jgi:hypothetical protein
MNPSGVAIDGAILTRRSAASREVDRDGRLLAALRSKDLTAAECLVARYGGLCVSAGDQYHA